MKILSANQIREADLFTIENEPVSSIDLMERAASACAEWIVDDYKSQLSGNLGSNEVETAIVCGTGNNGGDGLAIARMLFDRGFSVSLYVAGDVSKASPDFKVNYKRLTPYPEISIEKIDFEKVPDFKRFSLIIDALFGTGLKGPIREPYHDLIGSINQAKGRIISIDLPSGLLADEPLEVDGIGVQAQTVLTFQLPKLGLLLHENANFVGSFEVLDIGLSQEYLSKAHSEFYYFTDQDARYARRHRSKFSHKGLYGHALLIGGSEGMWGALNLATKACLRSGAGLVTAYTGRLGAELAHQFTPEVMVLKDEMNDRVSSVPKLDKYNAIAIGPGLGQSAEAEQALKSLIQQCQVPLVIDADALNILAENPTWLSFLPKGTVLTPHPGEFARLVGKKMAHFEALKLQKEWSKKYGITIVLKGAHSSVSLPSGDIWINSSGNAGMASAGMGDTLTGMITGLIASGYSPSEAAIFAVYLHGFAGDLALIAQSMESLIATDLISNIGNAFKSIG
jgi:NAD(P)H-hydrate epimerase